MLVKLNEKRMNLPKNFKENIIAKIETEKSKGVEYLTFDDLRLFFLDDESVKYDVKSDGFIHQFLIDNGYEVYDG